MSDDASIKINKPLRNTAPVEVSAADLQGHGVIHCPNPRMPLWSTHPRVFIDVTTTGEGTCPYCSTVYRLKGGAQQAH